MAIVVSYNALVEVNSVDLSNHCLQVVVNDGQETRDVTAMGDTSRRYRAGMGTASIDCTFWSDVANGSVSQTLQSLITMTSTGFLVRVRKDNSAMGANNPEYQMIAVVDGDINLVDEKPGEVSQLKARFLPYSTFTVYTTSS
jgi:hypothetical protein